MKKRRNLALFLIVTILFTSSCGMSKNDFDQWIKDSTKDIITVDDQGNVEKATEETSKSSTKKNSKKDSKEDATEEIEAEEKEESSDSLKPQKAAAVSKNYYGYQQLTKKEKKVYNQIVDAITSRKDEVAVSTLDSELLNKAFETVKCDYPDLFWVSGYKYIEYSRNGVTETLTFAPKYTMDEKTQKNQQKKIDKKVKKYLAKIPEGASDYEKVKILYEQLIKRVSYNLDSEDNQTIVSTFINEETVCQGYAYAMQYMLLKLGIPCTTISGDAGGESHAWNLVMLDGQYYYVDVTWGNSYSNKEEQQDGLSFPKINYNYLNITTQELENTHTIDNVVPVPECTALDDNYYVREGLYYDSFDTARFEQHMIDTLSIGTTQMVLKFASAELLQQYYEYYITQKNIFINTEWFQRVSSAVSDQHNVLYLFFQ